MDAAVPYRPPVREMAVRFLPWQHRRCVGARRPSVFRPYTWALWLKRLTSKALGRDARRPPPQPADGVVRSAQIEPLTEADVSSAVELAVRVLRVQPGDLGEQFASGITDDLRRMFVARASGKKQTAGDGNRTRMTSLKGV
jgi:hypothetical protein